MTRLGVVLTLLALVLGCQAAPTPAPEQEAPGAVPLDLTVPAAGGLCSSDPAVVNAAGSLKAGAVEGAERVARRLGIVMDPDRPRLLVIDAGTVPAISTRIVNGRVMQVLTVPLRPFVSGDVPESELLGELFARAALSDVSDEGLPDWFEAGAPLWVSGAWKRVLYGRILTGPVLPEGSDEVTRPVRLDAAGNDDLSAALFFRFLAQEFGAERIPSLTRALLSVDDDADAFRAALGADADSLPLAFESYRERVVGQILDAPNVRLLAGSRRSSEAERAKALIGAADDETDPWIAAAVLSDLALAQFEAGDTAGAAETFARLEDEHTGRSPYPARDRLFAALTFERSGDREAARARLDAFLRLDPDERYASLGLLEAASLHTRAGETAEAEARYLELVERFPESPHAVPARRVLAATACSTHRYGLARSLLTPALPDEAAQRALTDLDALEADGLPAAAAPAVRSAIRDLVGEDTARAEAAVTFLSEVGPLAGRELSGVLADGAVLTHPVKVRLRAIRVCAAWPVDGAWPVPLAHLLPGDDAEVAGALFGVLIALEVPPEQIRTEMERAPHATAVAAGEYDLRFGAGTLTERQVGSADFLERQEAAVRLAVEDHPRAVELLGRLLEDESPQVRRSAAGSLGRREGDAAAQALLGGLDDDSRLVRIEVLRSFSFRRNLDPVRTRGMADADPAVRIEAARLLWNEGLAEDVVLVVRLLNDPDGRVRTVVEEILTEKDVTVLGGALACALVEAEAPGLGVRIVRVMSHHTGIDFGYDAFGGAAERERVADAFRKAWLRRKKR